MRTAPGLVVDAIAAGLLDPAAVLDGLVVVLPRSRSNVVHRIDVDTRPVAYVKQRGAASLLDGDEAVANEARALDLLRSLPCVPRRIAVECPGSVWVAPAEGRELWSVADDTASLRAAGRAVGRALANLHLAPVDAGGGAAPVAPEPWALRPDHLPPSMRGGDPGSAGVAVLDVAAEPDVGLALALAASGWRRSHWIHGDLAASNVLVAESVVDQDADAEPDADPGLGEPARRVTFIDLEGAGLGDPDWDLVTVVASVRDAWVGTPAADDAADALVAEYVRCGGPGRLDHALGCVRSLMTAWQCAVVAGGASDQGAGDQGESWRRHVSAARTHAAAATATRQDHLAVAR